MATNNFFNKKQEWSKIKDSIISYYLKPYSAKILATHKPLKIVDCFAGKGKFDTGDKGSPLIISDIIESILSHENINTYTNKQIEACFIEKKYFNDLLKNTKECKKCKAINGSFEEHIDSIIANNHNINLFLYIDPYGIKNLSFSVFKKLSNINSATTEFLMNFNSFGFLREGFRLLKYSIPKDLIDETIDYEESDKNTIENMNNIANGDYWQKIINRKNSNEISMHTAEELFNEEYKKQLKTVYKYVLTIPIKVKTVHMPKYRLIFATNHHDGVALMLDKMNQSWYELTPKSGVFDIFEQPDNFGQNSHLNIEEEILKLTEQKIHIKSLILDLIDIFGIKYKLSEYKEKIKEMSNEKRDLFSNLPRSIKIIREYTTPKGKVPTDLDWNNEIYLERIK